MDITELCGFLVKAKIDTYAGGREAAILRDGSKELTLCEGKFLYRDRYFGFNPFIGEETVFYEGMCIWGMNYYGLALPSKDVPLKDVYAFLREVLRRVSEQKPFRGPEKYERKPFKYVNNVDGDVTVFSGTEKIFHKGKEIYMLLYHGGCAKGEAQTVLF
jgi:hypothetical protein